MRKILCIIGFLVLATSFAPTYGETLNQDTKILERLKEELKQNPYNTDNYCKFAKYYSSKNRPFLAISYYQKALEIFKDCKKAKYGLAEEYKKIDKYNMALELYLELLDEDFINKQQLYTEIGVSALKSGKSKLAEEYLAKALNNETNKNKTMYLLYNKALEYNKDYQKAIELNLQMIQDIPEEAAESYSNIGRYYIKLKHLDLALENYFKAIELDPESWYNYYVVGLIQKTNNQNKEAIGYFEKTINYNPTFESAYKEIIDIYKSNGEDYIADMYYQKYKNAVSKASSK